VNDSFSEQEVFGQEPKHPAYGVLRRVSATAGVVLERNPSVLTLEGTNSWVLRATSASSSVVIDPGHDDESHLDALTQTGSVSLVLLTHHHPDHADGAVRFAKRVNAPVRAFDPRWCVAAESLVDGEVISEAGLEIQVLHTPGHTDDSLTFVVANDDSAIALTGDTVLGRGTTGITDLSAYFHSLQKLLLLPETTMGLPGHGPELPDLRATVEYYVTHRKARLEQVREAQKTLGPNATDEQIVALVYHDIDQALSKAAAYNVGVQLKYLRDQSVADRES